METLPPSLQRLLLTAFGIRKTDKDPGFAGVEMHCAHGQMLFVVTRQQLLDIAAECKRCADSMPKPS